MAGSGLSFAAGEFHVGVANTGATGLSVESDVVRLTSSSNPGAAASILASDASGYLTLVRLIGTDRIRSPIIDTASGNLALTPATGITTGLELHMGTRVRTPVIDTSANLLTIQPANHVTYFPAPGSIGLGVSEPVRRLHIEDSTGAQMRLAYNTANYMDFLVDAGGSWRIAPTGDIIVDPDGNDMRPLDNYDINLGTPIKKYLTLHVAELWADTLVASDVRSTIGGKVWIAPTTELTRDLDGATYTFDTIAQRGTTTTGSGVGVSGGLSVIAQRGTTTTASGEGVAATPTVDLETGDLTQFNSTSDNAANTDITVVAGAAYNGSYGMRVTSAEASDNNTSAYARLNIAWPVSDELYIEWWWRKDYDNTTGYNVAENSKGYFSINGSGESQLIFATRASGNWNLCYMNGSFARTTLASWTPSDDTWYRFRLIVDRTGANTSLYFGYSTSGTSYTQIYSGSLSSARVNSIEPTNIDFGHVHINQFEKSAFLEDWDDFLLSDGEPAAGGNTSVSVVKPTGVTTDDVLVATVARVGGTLTPPSGWTEVVTQVATGATLSVYSVVAGGSEPANYTWSLDSTDAMSVAISAYDNVDTSNRIGGYAAQANSSSTSVVAPSITPITTADMLLFCGAIADNVRAAAPSGMTEDADVGITGIGVYVADQLLSGDEATGTRTATLESSAASAAALVSLRAVTTSATNTSFSVTKPTGVASGDVLVATVARVAGALTPPSGWTQILSRSSTGVTLDVYRLVAGGGEPSSYTWSLNSTDAMAVAISAYDNVDATTPVDIYSSQDNSSGTSMIAPSVTTTVATDQLIFAGAVAGNIRATAPSGMTEDADTGITGVGVYMADQSLSSSGATGNKTATLASSATSAAALIALRPSSTAGGAPPTTIYVKHNLFSSGDRVLMEARLQFEALAITSSYTEVVAGEEYSYTVTRNLDGTGANDWIAGDALVNTGTTGNGWIELYSVYGFPRDGQTSTQRAGPTIVGNVRTSTAFNAFRERWAVGNLNGLYDYSSSIYGAAFGDPTQTWISLDSRPSGDGGGLRFMNSLTEVGYIRNDGTWRFGRADNPNNYIAWNGTTMSVRGDVVVEQSNVQNAATFIETWESNDAIGRWQNYAGSGELTTVAVGDSVTGGRVLQVGNNSGNDQAWLVSNRLIPFDPSKLYRIIVRVRRTAGSGTLYVGFTGVGANGVTLVNASGADSYSSQHYHAASGVAPGAGWTTYIGYTKGVTATGSSAAGTAAVPGTMHQSVRYVRPLILCNHSGVAGIMQVDMISVETVASTWLDIDGTPTRLADSPTGNGLYLSATHMGFYQNSAWVSYFQNNGNFAVNGTSASNYITWNGTALTVSGVINVLPGGTAALTNLSNSVISTLISGNMIRVGSGTKDNTTSSPGNGFFIDNTEIVGQLNGVDQVVMDASGQITAGAGNVILNVNGVTILSPAAYGPSANRLDWSHNGFIMGTVWNYRDQNAPVTSITALGALAPSTSSALDSEARVYAISSSNYSSITLTASAPYNTDPRFDISMNGSLGGSWTRRVLTVWKTGTELRTTFGYALFGAQNSSYFHVSTDRPAFYFSQGVETAGTLVAAGVLTANGGLTANGVMLSNSTIGTAWTAFTPGGGFTNFGGEYVTAAYTIFGDYVSVRAMLSSPGTAGSTNVFTLPSGYAPSASIIFTGFSQVGAFRFDVTSAGVLRVVTPIPAGNWVSIYCTYKR